MPYRNNLERLPSAFTSSLVFTRLHSNGRLLALFANIRLGWKWMEVSNNLAYYDTATITAVKSFTQYFKTFSKIPNFQQNCWIFMHVRVGACFIKLFTDVMGGMLHSQQSWSLTSFLQRIIHQFDDFCPKRIWPTDIFCSKSKKIKSLVYCWPKDSVIVVYVLEKCHSA